jgi:uncharacterized SAM-binding protein YcdF (DUF218 family)
MFFYLAKILWFFLQPSTLIFAALIAGALLVGTAWRRTSRGLVAGSVATLLICGLLPVTDLMMQPLENRFPRPGPKLDGDSIAGIIVLGGAEDRSAWDRQELGGLNDAAERYTEAVVLARRFPGTRLVFAGGSGALVADLPPEAQTAKRIFEALGVEPRRIVLESQSRDTYENATFAARLLAPRPGQRWLLVTSAAHMPRAVGCFRKAGFNVVPWPVDYRTPRQVNLTALNRSIPDGLGGLDGITREYIGLVMYYLAGRTDALLPGP